MQDTLNLDQTPPLHKTSVSSCVFGDSEIEILKLKDESIDIICIDPPYLYLKNQKLEREFNENKFFEQCKRVLTKDGFIIMFGRGVSFYRMNCILNDLGFNFKEEIIWNKEMTASPLLPLSRVHETVSIFTKGKGVIRKNKVPYMEMREKDFSKILDDVNRLKQILKNTKAFDNVLSFLENKDLGYKNEIKTKFKTTSQGHHKDRCRSVSVMQSIKDGMSERSIIKEIREHYTAIHPTQKPVRLLERLIMLCLPDKPREEILLVDFFAGSFSCGEACYNLGVNFLGYEIEEEYYKKGIERMEKIKFQTKLF